MTLIILTGIPSIGKTSIAKELIALAEKNKIQITRVDSDDLRRQYYKEGFDPDLEAEIRNKALEKIDFYLREGFHVISDDLNYYRSMRHDLITLATQHGVNYFIIHVTAPLEQALEWNAKRGLPVPQDVIKKIQDKFDRLEKYRWDTPLLEIQTDKMTVTEASALIFETLHQRFFETPPVEKLHPPHVPSTLEHLDLALRTRISSFLSAHPDEQLAKTINDQKKKLLKRAKMNRLSFEESMSEFEIMMKKVGIDIN